MTAAVDSRRALTVAAVLGGYAALLALAPSARLMLTLAAPLLLIPLLWWIIQTPSRWLAAFFFCALLLPPLPIALGDSGPHVALLFAALGLFVGLLRLAEWRLPSGPLPATMLLFAGVLFSSVSLAALYSGAPVAFASLARVILFAISVYIFFYTAYGPGARPGVDHLRAARMLFGLAVASAFFACLDFYFQFPAPAGYGPQFVWLDSGVFRRAQGIFYEASTLGNFCAFFLVMIAAAFLAPKHISPISRRAMFLGGAVLSTALVLSYSRGSLINVLTAVCVLLYLRRKSLNFRRLAAAVFLAACAAAIVFYAVFPSFALSYWTRLWVSGQYFFSATNGVLSGRLDSWRLLGAFLFQQPWHAFLGIGYKTLPYSDFIGQTAIADNMYLSLLVETGVVGLGVFLVFNAAILRSGWKAAHSVDSRTSFFGTWLVCFWAGEIVQMLTGDLFTYWRVLPVYFWLLALTVRVEKS